MREFESGQPEAEERVGDTLRDAGHTVAVAESCTGGLIGSLLTDVPGSSDYFDRSLVTYSYDAKRHELAVSRESLDEHGAVSEPVAGEMAAGVRDIADTTWGLATTGIAGPDGGLPGKPVGTVFVGIAFAAPWGSGDSYTRVERFEYDGSRTQVKEQIARGALELLREEVESVSENAGD
ncbi:MULTISPECIES: CinA family protein [Haloferax]|uniref:Nicotinamide-nucleotide amidohydrolase family protein n=2 Tax=Haloferax TaxID=2251 RepID=A0A6G1YYK1_9EURY|nr:MULTISPECIES: CinA family protein [Haloferax]KAB1186518.1 CinA family protein [Haloferax sp. CBA1149]MRW79124.1 nicotinamide-nucleotide amidohydrolase family protein [Haloferax marinisediminis]